MRLHSPVFLAILLFVSVATESTALQSLSTNTNDVPRLLRSHPITTTEGEERVGGLNTIANAVKSTAAKFKQTKELKGYLKQQQSADEVFALLKLTDKTDNILTHPKIEAMAKYITMLNKENPRNRVQLIDVLAARLGDDVVSRMIEAAKSIPTSKKLADKLQTDQFRGWFERETTPVALVGILKLDDAANMGNANFKVLEKYLNVYNSHFNKKMNIVEVFRRGYGGQQNLAKALVALPETNTNAKELQRQLFTKWATVDKYTRNEYLKNVMKRDDTNWFSHPLANVFIHYSNFLNKAKVPNVQ
ncbi:hypothetical protein P3T76_007818 [Phytophthora citrophthora]|uniref:RxLR effector protein n=1 Tax=Phytophthora citrophthora TaxID=4793 RepID=A0AAD9GME0_9STRA|nr:hypothetical protein P3T76_007818 [Phytophthora citrophthora]